MMGFVLKSQTDGCTVEAHTYRALQLEGFCAGGEGSACDEVWVIACAPLCQDTVPVHRHAGLHQRLPHGAFELVVVETRHIGAERRLHQVYAGTSDAERQEGFYRGVNVNCIPIDNDVP